jgi:exoribonuclease R
LKHIENNETRTVLQNWNNGSGKYILYDKDVNFEHQMMGLNSPYCHITSPIRRIVDLLNQTMIYNSIFPHYVSLDARSFIEKWINKLALINESTKSTRKIQNECKILDECFGKGHDVMKIAHAGILFERSFSAEKNIYIYTVYLEKLKLISKIKTEEKFDNNSEHLFNIYLFENEENTKKKIKLSFSS